MQKTLDILERNVQWIALGIGGILLLWSVYRYVVTPPVAVKIGTTLAGPDEAARLIAQGPVKALQDQIANQRAQPPAPLDLVSPFQVAMDRVQPPNDYFALAFNAKTAGGIEGPTPGKVGGNRPQIAAAPQLPPAKPGQPLTGLSVISRPLNPAANQNASAVQPVKAVAEDLAWVTVPFKISAAELKNAFGQLNGQLQLKTAVLEVVLQRQRATSQFSANGPTFPAGDQGIETVKPLRIYQGPGFKSLPSEQSPKNQKYEFIQWATDHSEVLSQPAFYEVSGGDTWTSPLQQQENATVQNQADQTTGTGNDTGGTSPDNSTQPTDTSPGTSQPQSQPAAQPASGRQPAQPAPAGRPSYAPDDSDRPTGGYDPRSGYRGRYGRGGFGGRGPGFGGFNNAGNGNGAIDPLNLPADLTLWAHDETARPGQIYRYRVIYVMKNPLFGTAGIATQQLSDLLALTSPPSEWTAPVTVPAKTKFWVKAIRGGNNGVNLDVFQWVKGNWKAPKTMGMQPGDVVPGTDWTVVDVHAPSDSAGRDRDMYVLLTNDAGELSSRFPNIDNSDQTYKDLKDQTDPKKATEQNPSAVMPGRGYRGYPTPGGRRPYGR